MTRKEKERIAAWAPLKRQRKASCAFCARDIIINSSRFSSTSNVQARLRLGESCSNFFWIQIQNGARQRNFARRKLCRSLHSRAKGTREWNASEATKQPYVRALTSVSLCISIKARLHFSTATCIRRANVSSFRIYIPLRRRNRRENKRETRERRSISKKMYVIPFQVLFNSTFCARVVINWVHVYKFGFPDLISNLAKRNVEKIRESPRTRATEIYFLLSFKFLHNTQFIR